MLSQSRSRLLPLAKTVWVRTTLQMVGRHVPAALASQQMRWRTPSRTRAKLDRLDEMAHEGERNEARLRRQKKKEKEEAKKNRKGKKEEEVIIVELPDVKKIRAEMMEIVKQFDDYIKTVRGAEPKPELFDHIKVDAYEETVPLKEVAQIVIENPKMATVTCYDPEIVKDVYKAFHNPRFREHQKYQCTIDDRKGGVLKVDIPPVTTATRAALGKEVYDKMQKYLKEIRKIYTPHFNLCKEIQMQKVEGIPKDDGYKTKIALKELLDEITELMHQKNKEKARSLMDMDEHLKRKKEYE